MASSHKIKKRQRNGASIIFEFLENNGLQLHSTADQFLMAIQNTLKEAHQPHRLHGLRVEAMFSYVAGALGKCALIKQEDTSGICLAENTAFKIPDYKVILKDGSQLFIEVKNCHKLKIEFKKSYIEKLLAYAETHKLPLKIAVYWSKLKVWTLVPVGCLDLVNHKTCVLEFGRALAISEMAMLGDASIGIRLPLRIRLLSVPESVDNSLDGKLKFTINKVEIYNKDLLIEDKFEWILAFQLMRWHRSGSAHFIMEPLITDEKLIGIEWRLESYEEAFDKQFEIIGSLSTIISNQYNTASAPDGHIDKLIPSSEPEKFSVYIPENYKGKYLPIWRFTVQPNQNFT